MKWSKYALFFRSAKHGHLVYSALTNTFGAVAEATAVEIERIRRDPDSYDFTGCPELLLQLVMAKVLVEPGEEEELIRVNRLQRLYQAFDASTASFTIVPTLACNFACTYCYEEFRQPVHMQEETEERLVAFVRRFRGLQSFHVEWFGGEPTLRFETMCRISRKLDGLGTPWTASLVTNGYLLDADLVAKLDALRVETVQVTLDGAAAAHDRRRPLAGGGPTYERILQNVGGLLERWGGRLLLRINVDHTNSEGFFTLRNELLTRFAEKRITVYPGFVIEGSVRNPHGACTFDREAACRFQVEAYRRHGIEDLPFYPELRNGCGATDKNSFVIGPEGEIYKCYIDVGTPGRVIGSIEESRPWNLGLLANYMVGASVFEDPACRDCFFLPLCDGGCRNARMRGGDVLNHVHTCVHFREMLPEWLEIHFEIREKAAARGDDR
jgi:uncharacterized protein